MTKEEFTEIIKKLVEISPRWESVTGVEVVPLYDVMETLHQYVDGEMIEEKPFGIIIEKEPPCPLFNQCNYWDPIAKDCLIGGSDKCFDHGCYSSFEEIPHVYNCGDWE